MKRKFAAIALGTYIGTLIGIAAMAQEITLSATGSDVSDVTNPLMDLVIQIWRTVLGPLLGYAIVFAAVVGLYGLIRAFFGWGWVDRGDGFKLKRTGYLRSRKMGGGWPKDE